MDTPFTPKPDEAELAGWLGLLYTHGLGPRGICLLLSEFGHPTAIWNASHAQLSKLVSANIATQLCAGIPACVQASLDWLKLSDQNHIITLADEHYPKRLLEIIDPPPVLYAKGQLKWLNTPSLAVVGSRHATPQGEKNAEAFSKELTLNGYTVISGMALGIDGAAHRGALQGNGATIAVVGTGLDIVYPAKHRSLAHQIAEVGLILSEFVIGTPSITANFPKRNRIISGLSQGCLVVEANIQSGSLITAKLATEQGREVFAIPGSIHSPVSKGCHQLIKQGAKLVDGVQDILEELNYPSSSTAHPHQTTPATTPLDTPKHPLLLHIGYEPISIEQLIDASGLTSSEVSSMLLVLELEGKVASLAGGQIQRIA